jgi:hypothetical protein
LALRGAARRTLQGRGKIHSIRGNEVGQLTVVSAGPALDSSGKQLYYAGVQLYGLLQLYGTNKGMLCSGHGAGK